MTEKTKKAALEMSNSLKNQGVEVPRECHNPGIYIGFIKGAEFMQSKVDDVIETFKLADANLMERDLTIDVLNQTMVFVRERLKELE